MGVAGAFLTLSAFNAFFFNMVNGRGWICVALVVFAGWRPGKALAGALLFAFFDALQLRLQQQAGGIPYQVYLMLPYVLSIARAGRRRAPRNVSAGVDEAVAQRRALTSPALYTSLGTSPLKTTIMYERSNPRRRAPSSRPTA